MATDDDRVRRLLESAAQRGEPSDPYDFADRVLDASSPDRPISLAPATSRPSRLPLLGAAAVVLLLVGLATFAVRRSSDPPREEIVVAAPTASDAPPSSDVTEGIDALVGEGDQVPLADVVIVSVWRSGARLLGVDESGALHRVDVAASTATAVGVTLADPASVESLAADSNGVWVVDGSGLAFWPVDGTDPARPALADSIVSIVEHDRVVWALSNSGEVFAAGFDDVARLDPIAEVGGVGSRLAAGAGALWVLDAEAGSIAAIGFDGTILGRSGVTGSLLDAGPSGAWVTGTGPDSAVRRFTLDRGAVSTELQLSMAPIAKTALHVGDDAVWVVAADEASVIVPDDSRSVQSGTSYALTAPFQGNGAVDGNALVYVSDGQLIRADPADAEPAR